MHAGRQRSTFAEGGPRAWAGGVCKESEVAAGTDPDGLGGEESDHESPT